MSVTAIASECTEASHDQAPQPVEPPGGVSGVVLRCVRLSAGLSQAQLAEAAGMDETSIARHEDGTLPLADVAYPVLEHLENVLAMSGAEPGLLADLTAAIWCDLVIAAARTGQDLGCLLADPTTAEEAFRELLAWSLSFGRPARYLPYTTPCALLRPAEIKIVASAIRRFGWTGRYLARHAA